MKIIETNISCPVNVMSVLIFIEFWSCLSVCRQFTFVVLFSTFLLTCVNYDVLFKEGKYNASQKVTISDTIYPVDTWTARY